ncbi:hypothetical protein Smp_189130 [Schistosoma mansoni]|uniref:hypothetical protein n=1 Tax=Schistosoma mansoni TaxID=6183 RepID=UPI00022DCA1C|nr:hypothetical protein Smp_189130 [Schistosoma mansoni]|eukprot:XP_018654903.1 hypothetical protein Smp_189130 [Schistosoma mansoni]
MVPFRLTRDLVHALGPLGLQTGFIPAAETVLRELRNGSDVILTLLQVSCFVILIVLKDCVRIFTRISQKLSRM